MHPRYDAPMPASPALLADSILHTLDPFVFEISPGMGPRWYGTAYLAGFVVGWLVLRWLATSGRIPLSARQVGDLVTNCIVGVIAGGRIGHCLFYEPHLFVEFTDALPPSPLRGKPCRSSTPVLPAPPSSSPRPPRRSSQIGRASCRERV